MTRITFPLRVQMRGPEVGNLQDALLLFVERRLVLAGDEAARRDLAELLRTERGEQLFGAATARLVTMMRAELGLPAGRDVDEATAAAMNSLLRELGVLDRDPVPRPGPGPASPPAFHVVSGEVRREDGVPVEGVRVRAAHEAGQRSVRLGEDATDADGRYTIRYELLPGLAAVDLRVSAVDEDGVVLAGAELVRRARPVEIVDVAVPMSAPRARRRLEGQVVLEHGVPAENLKLRLYRRDYGGKTTLLAEAGTVADGRYAFAYDAGDGAAILEVRAVKAGNEEVALSKPLQDMERSPRAVLNLVAPGELNPAEAEYRRLAAGLAPQVGELKRLAGAAENGERQDLTVLNRATGWDARLIALAAVTERLAADPDVRLPQEGLYGLLRAGLPSDKLLLAQVDADVVEQALKKVTDADVVALSDPQIGEFKRRFAAFSDRVRLNIPAPGSRSTYRELLEASGLPQDARARFAPVFLERSRNGSDLWAAARDAGLSDAQVRTLRLQGKLAFLAGNSEAMTSRLMAKRIDDSAELVNHGLHRTEAWAAEVLEQAGVPEARRENLTAADRKNVDALIPPAYTGETAEDRLRAYSEDMSRKVRLSYPTQVVARRLETEAAFKLPAAHDATVTLLKQAAGQGFRLGETPVVAFLEASPALTAGMPAADAKAARQGLVTLQRVYQITPGDDAMPVLLALDMASAYDVMAYDETEFQALFDAGYLEVHKTPAPKGLARLIHRKARQVSSVTYNLFTIAKKLESEPPVAGLSATPEVRETVRNELIKRFPTMESLFGSLDFCECDHCRSVLSPAAYLVDLLQFIDPEPGEWANFLAHWKATHGGAEYPHKDANGNALKPYDVLVERRPDLPHIPLTCENTHTALPYIDITNEILEYYVAHGKLEKDAARDTGSATTAELLAEPQNVIREAYDEVRSARYPVGLPFDLWIETVRRFCDHFETPLERVLEVLRPGDELFDAAARYDRAAIFKESLGLSPAEAAVFTDPDPLATWHELYGFATAAEATTVATDADTGQRIDLNSAKALARRLGVTYKQLAEIVQTGFVNPGMAPLRLLPKLGISIQDAVFFLAHKDDPPPTTDEEKKQRLEVEAFRERVAGFAREFRDAEAAAAALTAQLLAEIEAIPFDQILVLADPDAGCDFDRTTLRYGDGADADAIAFLRINLFVRLWRELGWSIEETDRALSAFVPSSAPFDADPANLAKQPLETALIHLSHLKALDDNVKAGKQSRLKLLTFWTELPTTGTDPLYAQLFLTRSVLKSAPVFDDPLGRYLADPAVKVGQHVPALQGALGLTAEEIGRILADAGVLSSPEHSLDAAPLTLSNVSVLYRYGLLARALKLSVRELITLKQISGRDPFTALHPDPLAVIAEDHPYSQTLRFVEMAEEVKASGFKIEDLDFLLRQRFDGAGKYRPDRDGTLALLRTLAAGIRAIRAGHAVPADPGAMTEEDLRQKLGLVLPAAVVETFLAMLNGTAEFTATRPGVDAADRLDAEVFEADERVRELAYKEVPHKEQKLTLRGVLFPAGIAALKAQYDPKLSAVQKAVFADLLAGARDAARTFFDTHLRKQAPGFRPDYGFLDAADFDLLFDPGLAPGDTEQDRLRRRRARLAEVFLPFLQQRLIRQLILDSMAAQTGADPALVQSLVTDPRLLKDAADRRLLDAFDAVGASGVSAAFFDADDLSDPAQPATPVVRDVDTSLKDSTAAGGNPLGPAGSAWFEGYLDVPEPGAYRFYIELDKQDAEATLRFEHLPDPVFLDGTAGADGATLGDGPGEFIELKPGIPYRFRLELKKLGGGGARLRVQGETLPKGPLSRLVLYPSAAFDSAEHALLLLAKSLQLVQGLGLGERETRYLLTHAPAFGNVDLSRLPTRTDDDSPASLAAAVARFTAFLRLAAYARLKQDIAAGTDDLIDVFEADEARDPADVYRLIARLTRRPEATVKDAAEALAAVPRFESEIPLRRLWDTLQVVERFGAPVASLVAWTRIVDPAASPHQRFDIARDIKEAVKARFEPDTWQRLAQPIFDNLRQRQRDALVALVMHERGFERIEQLYEYFLIDPGMEPVVQTSRIRLAIASVQLFIQRCLLNLEPKVHPSTVKSKHWEWMKRYRVWEANRKIFLFPENWLEPEFRDDKTHLFAELEGALLQGDVSSDLVEDAFLNYLKKLDELARLDVVAMHIEDDPDPARRTLHVFGRTFSKPHQYFYRRYAHQMWTPWEPVGAEIEGDHLAPVVWRDRLYLFWVTFLTQADPDARPSAKKSGGKEKSLSELSMTEAASSLGSLAAKKIVEVQLHWSEYVQGEWSSGVASDYMLVTTPLFGKTAVTIDGAHVLGDFGGTPVMSLGGALGGGGAAGGAVVAAGKASVAVKVDAGFTPAKVFVHVSKAYEPTGEEAGVYVHLGEPLRCAFHLAGRNSEPELRGSGANGARGARPANPYSSASGVRATRHAGSGALRVQFKERITTEPGKTPPSATPGILRNGRRYLVLAANNNLTALGVSEDTFAGASDPAAMAAAVERGLAEIASLIKPVFYQDDRHTFFVEPDVTERTIEEWDEWVVKPALPEGAWLDPAWWDDLVVIAEQPWMGPLPDPRDPWSRFDIDRGSLTQPRPDRDWLVNPATVLDFDGTLIGPTGQPGLKTLPAELLEQVGDAGVQLDVNPGSELPPGSVVALTGADTLEEVGLVAAGGGLNVVGSAGLNAGLGSNFIELNRTGFAGGVAAGGTSRR